ncbi:MAG TPA: type VI secretion system tip protein TssI/VgrG, partial [Gemmatimonadaceae bacterium]|nr:type VI secretion system tip protein TssI/VgrG [Gemmatimonadaceae bacterium]
EQALNEGVYDFRREYAVHTGKHEIRDHALLRPNNEGNVTASGRHAIGSRFDFLGDLGPERSAPIARLRIEGEEQGHDTVYGSGSCASFGAGSRVTITQCPGGTVELHLVSVTHELVTGDLVAGSNVTSRYANDFVAIPAATKFHPPCVTPRPSVRGTQTAIIVGSGGKGAIDVDKDGRVLLEFPWDRGAGKGGKSDFRVHVASVWAGGKWGFVQHPRVGQEVLVEFLEGEVDRPIVTGRVYNSALQYPYDLPANKTQAGWKSQTLDGGADNFNEIRFDDKKGSEHIFMQAEKDLQVKVKNDETRDVLHDRTTTIKNHDTRTVKEGNDKHTVEKGNQSVEVSKGDQTIKVATGKQTITVKADQSTTIESGNRTVTINQGNDTLGVKMGNISIKADAGSITVQAMQKIELKVGANSIVIDMTGVTVKGTMVKIEAQAQAEMKSPMTKVEGSGMMQVKGAMTQVNGDGMLMAKGGITMIN